MSHSIIVILSTRNFLTLSAEMCFFLAPKPSAVGIVPAGGDVEYLLPTPTKDMAKLWGRVRQLRAYLRTQRQEYMVSH